VLQLDGVAADKRGTIEAAEFDERVVDVDDQEVLVLQRRRDSQKICSVSRTAAGSPTGATPAPGLIPARRRPSGRAAARD
jgi:hypothetical protein